MTSWNHVTFVDIVVKFKEKREERYPSMYLRGKNIDFKSMLRQLRICKSQSRKAEVYSETYNVERIITSRKNCSVSFISGMTAGSDLNRSFAKCMFKANKSSIKIQQNTQLQTQYY